MDANPACTALFGRAAEVLVVSTLHESFDDAIADLPIVLMSGYSEPELGRREGDANVAGFLQKPFWPGDLLEFVYRLARQC